METGEVLGRVRCPGEVKGTGEVETLIDLLLVLDEAHVITLILSENKTSIEIHVCLRLDVVIVRCLHLHSVADGAEAVGTGVHDRAHVPQKDIMINDFVNLTHSLYFSCYPENTLQYATNSIERAQ